MGYGDHPDDGKTIALHPHPVMEERETPGFGCPHCATPLMLDSKFVVVSLVRAHVLPCCGYHPTNDELARWLRAARLIMAGARP